MSHIRGPLRAAVARTSARYIKGGCKSGFVGFSDVFYRGISLRICMATCKKHNTAHYFARAIGRAFGMGWNPSGSVSKYGPKKPTPMLERAKIDVIRALRKYMSRKDRPLG